MAALATSRSRGSKWLSSPASIRRLAIASLIFSSLARDFMPALRVRWRICSALR